MKKILKELKSLDLWNAILATILVILYGIIAIRTNSITYYICAALWAVTSGLNWRMWTRSRRRYQ